MSFITSRTDEGTDRYEIARIRTISDDIRIYFERFSDINKGTRYREPGINMEPINAISVVTII